MFFFFSFFDFCSFFFLFFTCNSASQGTNFVDDSHHGDPVARLHHARKLGVRLQRLITLMTSIHIAISGPMASQLHLINSAMWKNKRPTANTTCLAKRPAGNNPKENPATTSSGTGEEFEETYSTSKGRR